MSSASTGGTEGSSPASSPASATNLTMASPKYGTLVPNRIFVGGISASTSEAELAQLFSAYGNVKATKIISDRAGVSKGYGFVTFETEEEAKRLQQVSESIILRERKLNIAPAIKKQPFNRSFDGGSGSPPSVPTSTYYYTNGMGLTYQNGMTFYNTAAPTAGTPIASPSDPTTIYQATGVFGHQAAAGHQPFAPVMYSCPAPSLYMPQQYQYSPVPYESYYTGTAATGASPYIYATTGNSQNSTNPGSNSGSGSNGTGTGSPPTGIPTHLQSLPPPPTHFYAPAAPPPPHHHPSVPTGPPPPQVEHLYYPFATGPHPPPPPPQHAPISLTTDQQLLLYPTDTSCQQSSASDNQIPQQEDCRPTSSHSEQQQPHGGEAQAASGSATSLVSLMPVKFPLTTRYTNYHPIAIHATNLHHSQTCLNEAEDCPGGVSPMHCRTILYHPTALYIPHSHTTSAYHGGASASTSGNTGSLLPTPPTPPSSSSTSSQGFDLSKTSNIHHSRDYTKSCSSTTTNVSSNNGYNTKSQGHGGIALIHHHQHQYQNTCAKAQTQNSHKYINNGGDKYSNASVNSSRVQYNKRSSPNVSACYLGQRVAHYAPNPSNYYKNSGFSSANFPQSYSVYSGSQQKNVNSNQTFDHANGRSDHVSGGKKNYKNNSNYRSNSSIHNENNTGEEVRADTCSNQSHNTSDSTDNSGNKSTSPPPPPYSPMTQPLPTLSPPIQVQFYTPATQNRYQTSSSMPPTSQQQPTMQSSSSQRRYTSVAAPPSLSSNRKITSSEKYSSTGSQTSRLGGSTKFKVNGMMQTAGKVPEENLGGAGDASTANRIPITPPGTPRNHPTHSSNDQNQLNETCHQMQALSL